MTVLQVQKVANVAAGAEQLEVYKLVYGLSLELHKLTLAFPMVEQHELATQLRRASKNIVLNLTEGYSRLSQSRPEFARFLSASISAVSEVKLLLNYTNDLHYISAEQAEWLQEQYEKALRMLQVLRSNQLMNDE